MWPVTGIGDGPFRAPNDLCVTPDGTVWFTDPPQFPFPAEPVGRVWMWAPGRRSEVFAGGFTYCNGIGVDQQGQVVIVEVPGLLRIGPDGARSWLVETLPSGGDGFAFDMDGNIYVASGRDVNVVAPDGAIIDRLEAPEGPAMMTNCCCGDADRRTLYATDGGSGRVLAYRGRPVPGVPLSPASNSAGHTVVLYDAH